MSTEMGNSPADAIRARLLFRAVLPAVGELLQKDARAQSLAGRRPWSARFLGPGGLETRLAMVPEAEGEGPEVGIRFGSETAAARLLRGGNAVPRSISGFAHPGLLVRLARVMLRFQRLLRPPAGKPLPPAERDLHVRLALHVALLGLRELRAADPYSRSVALPPGLARFHVAKEDFDAWIESGEDGLEPHRGPTGRRANANIVFRDARTAMDLLNDRLDGHEALARGLVAVSGYVPLADGLSVILDRLNFFLNGPGRGE